MGTVEFMTATSERYRKNAAGFTTRVEDAPPDTWENQSPDEEWTARDVVRHCIDVSSMFLGFVDVTLPDAPSVDNNPVAAWASARDTMQRALEDPAIAEAEYEGQLGKSTFEQGVARFVAPDVLLHTWDLARATGQDEHLDPSGLDGLLEAWTPLDEKMRTPGGFGPKIDPPQADDLQTRVLNFTGRRV
jgi:uncharacterized protein (TIGR03086 family)